MKTAYAQMFDDFVRGRGIDEDDRYWTKEDWEAWRVLVQGSTNFQLKTSKEEGPTSS